MYRSAKTSGGVATTPGSYELNSVKLTMNDGQVIEIKSLVSELVINESLFQQSIQVDIKIVDGFDLLQKSHLSGGEKIDIRVRRLDNTEESYSKAKNKFDITCYIAEIYDHSKPKPGIQFYRISCLSEHAFISNTKSISRSFNGNANALVRDICVNDLKFTGKTNFADKNLAAVSGIYPNLKPLEAITWLLRNSDDEETPFFFYETLSDGLQFNSYGELVDQETYKTYNNTPFFVNEFETKEHFEEASAKIIEMTSDFNMSKYKQINDGAFSAVVHSIDISTKSYNVVNFNHEDSNKVKLNQYKGFSKNIQFDGSSLNESYDSKEFFISTNSNAFGNNGSQKLNYHEKIKDSISNKNSYFHNIKFMGLDLALYGDFKLCPGKIINLKISKSTDENILTSKEREGMIDKLLSGKYLVASVAHIFDGNEYTCDIGVQKDSLGYDLDSRTSIGKTQGEGL